MPPIKRDSAGRVNTTDAADLIGCSDKTLRNWKRAGCHAVEEGGLVDVAGVVTWLVEREKAKASMANAASVDGLTLEEVQVRHEIVKTRKSENAVAAEDERLIEIGLYEHVISVLISEAKGRLYAIGSEVMDLVAAESDPVKCRKIYDERVDAALARVTVENAMNPSVIADESELPDDEDEAPEPATKTRSKSPSKSSSSPKRSRRTKADAAS